MDEIAAIIRVRNGEKKKPSGKRLTLEQLQERANKMRNGTA
jgi:hypothetical protein